MYRDVLIQTLHEITGKPIKDISAVFDIFEETAPPLHSLSKELSDDEADKLLSGFRKESSGILAWCVRSGMMAYLEDANPKGHA